MLSSYVIGYKARERGKAKEDNPFPQVGQWRKNWDKGWDDADAELGSVKRRVVPLVLVKDAGKSANE